VEWKYTESYSKGQTDDGRNKERFRRYKDIAIWKNGPLRIDCGLELVELFTEPIYQLLRLQMLAMQMEKDPKLGVDRVLVVLIAPRANLDLGRLKIPRLQCFGSDVSSAWKALLHHSDRFILHATEDLFRDSGPALQAAPNARELKGWHRYISDRYSLV
jgi:hypothetical protein